MAHQRDLLRPIILRQGAAQAEAERSEADSSVDLQGTSEGLWAVFSIFTGLGSYWKIFIKRETYQTWIFNRNIQVLSLSTVGSKSRRQ